MQHARQTIWRLVNSTAQELTASGNTPFTRGDLIKGVQKINPRYGPDSINPIIQGLTDNLRGGAPGAVGKNILHSVGRGRFVLNPQFRNGVADKKQSAEENEEGRSEGLEVPVPEARENKGFRFACRIEPAVDATGKFIELRPHARYGNNANLELNRYGRGPFCKFAVPSSLNRSGVYVIVVDGEPAYVGECENLSDRFNNGYGNISPRNCYKGGQETNCRINSLILETSKTGASITLHFLETGQRKKVEAAMRKHRRYKWNRT